MSLKLEDVSFVYGAGTSSETKALNNVNLEITEDKYSVVGLPALIPGINPPFFLILFDISAGLNVAYV